MLRKQKSKTSRQVHTAYQMRNKYEINKYTIKIATAKLEYDRTSQVVIPIFYTVAQHQFIYLLTYPHSPIAHTDIAT